MKLLIIDDSTWNLSPWALAGLGAQDTVILVNDTELACSYLKESRFDAVLTDLWMPYSRRNGIYSPEYAEDFYAGTQTPAGAAFALKCALSGIPVAICTDSNHQFDKFVELLDLLPVEGQQILKIEARCVHQTIDKNFLFYCPATKQYITEKYDEKHKQLFIDSETGFPVEVDENELRIVKNWSAVLQRLLMR